jgi:hypothetical protein
MYQKKLFPSSDSWNNGLLLKDSNTEDSSYKTPAHLIEMEYEGKKDIYAENEYKTNYKETRNGILLNKINEVFIDNNTTSDDKSTSAIMSKTFLA